ncbi:MAG: group II truncated hemoglobin [Kofleriaceae bacterium]
MARMCPSSIGLGEMTTYGEGSASYVAAGERDGIARLVDAFYRQMDELPIAATIRAMHEQDLGRSREKLTVFLCGWLGGPNLYSATFGPISIPRVHEHLAIGESERDAWLACMARAVEQQPWTTDFKHYFMRAIAVPAERVRLASARAGSPRAGVRSSTQHR